VKNVKEHNNAYSAAVPFVPQAVYVNSYPTLPSTDTEKGNDGPSSQDLRGFSSTDNDGKLGAGGPPPKPPIVKPLMVPVLASSASDSDRPPSPATVKRRNDERDRVVPEVKNTILAKGKEMLVQKGNGWVKVVSKDAPSPRPGQTLCECGNPSNNQCRGCHKNRCPSCLGRGKKNCSANVQCAARGAGKKKVVATRGKRDRHTTSPSNSSNDDEASSGAESVKSPAAGPSTTPVASPAVNPISPPAILSCTKCAKAMSVDTMMKCSGGCGQTFHLLCLESDGSAKARVCPQCTAMRLAKKSVAKKVSGDPNYELGEMMESGALNRAMDAIIENALLFTGTLVKEGTFERADPHMVYIDQQYVSDGTYREQQVQWLDPKNGARCAWTLGDIPAGTWVVTILHVAAPTPHWAVAKWKHTAEDDQREIVVYDSLGSSPDVSGGVQQWVDALSKKTHLVGDGVKMAQFPVGDTCGPCSINTVMTIAMNVAESRRVWFPLEVFTDTLLFKSWVAHYFGTRTMKLSCPCCDGPVDNAKYFAVECKTCRNHVHTFCSTKVGRQKPVCIRCQANKPVVAVAGPAVTAASSEDSARAAAAIWALEVENSQNPSLELSYLAAENGLVCNTKGMLRGMMEYVCDLQGSGKYPLGFFMPGKVAIPFEFDLLRRCGQNMMTFGHIPAEGDTPPHFFSVLLRSRQPSRPRTLILMVTPASGWPCSASA
jgi:hypothetical protein